MKRFSVLTSLFACSLLSACAGNGDGQNPLTKDSDSDHDAGKPAKPHTSTPNGNDVDAALPTDEQADSDTHGDGTEATLAPELTLPDAAPTASGSDEGLVPGLSPASSDGGSVVAASLQSAEHAVFRIEATGTFVLPGDDEQTAVSGGTGFVIDAEGYAVTNAHVVSGATLLRVQFPGEDDALNARIVAQSECSDLALLKIDGRSEFPHLEWSETEATLGLDVMSLGYPLGGELTLTEGIVSKESTSANTDWASVDDVIEHTAIINPGNSGGPLLSSDYHVVGINYAGNSYNQYFAIGPGEGQRIIGVLRQGEDIESIGLVGTAVSTDTLSGIWVYSVKAGSAADVAGIQPGDLVTHFGGIPLVPNDKGVMTMEDYCDILRTHSADATIDVRVLRIGSNDFSLWEGQVNGRKLQNVTEPDGVPTTSPTATTAPTATGTPTVTPEPAPTPTAETLQIQHPEGSIAFDVPGAWSEARAYDIERFDSAPGHALGASSDLNAFDEYITSGVMVSVWASDAELDDGGAGDSVTADDIIAQYAAYDDCDVHFDHEIGGAEGWTSAILRSTDCGENADLIAVDLGIQVSGQYTLWLRLHAQTEAELDALELVLDSLVVDVDQLP